MFLFLFFLLNQTPCFYSIYVYEGRYIKMQSFEKNPFLYMLFMTVHIDLELFHKDPFCSDQNIFLLKVNCWYTAFCIFFSFSVGQGGVFIFCWKSILQEQEIWVRNDSMLSCDPLLCVKLPSSPKGPHPAPPWDLHLLQVKFKCTEICRKMLTDFSELMISLSCYLLNNKRGWEHWIVPECLGKSFGSVQGINWMGKMEYQTACVPWAQYILGTEWESKRLLFK